jgi:hypothetical protein
MSCSLPEFDSIAHCRSNTIASTGSSGGLSGRIFGGGTAECGARQLQRRIRKLAAPQRPIGSVVRSLRQPVIQPLGTLKLSVGPGAFALPRAASLDSGVLAGTPGNLIGTAVAVRGEIACEVREDAITVCVSKSAGTLVRAAIAKYEKGIKAICRTQVQRS